MDAEARKQRTGDTIDPLRHPLIAAAHPRQGEQAGNHHKPGQRLDDNQQENTPARTSADAVTHEQREHRAEVDDRFRIRQIGQQSLHEAASAAGQLHLRLRRGHRLFFQRAAQHLVAHPAQIQAATDHDDVMQPRHLREDQVQAEQGNPRPDHDAAGDPQHTHHRLSARAADGRL